MNRRMRPIVVVLFAASLSGAAVPASAQRGQVSELRGLASDAVAA